MTTLRTVLDCGCIQYDGKRIAVICATHAAQKLAEEQVSTADQPTAKKPRIETFRDIVDYVGESVEDSARHARLTHRWRLDAKNYAGDAIRAAYGASQHARQARRYSHAAIISAIVSWLAVAAHAVLSVAFKG